MRKQCRRCKERGQDWVGDAPKCGFPGGLSFDINNWNCATLNALREIAEQGEVGSEDQYVAVIPREGEFLVLSWYKHRGRTEGVWVVSGTSMRGIKLQDAERFLEAYETVARRPQGASA